MGTWQIVGMAWRITGANLALVGMLFVIYLVPGLFNLPFVGQQDPPTSQAIVAMAVIALASFLVWPLIEGGCLAFVNGRLSQVSSPSAFASFWEGARKLYGRLLWLNLLMVAAIPLVMIVGITLMVAASLPASTAPAISVVLVLLACAAPAIALYLAMLILAMAPIAVAVEQRGVFAAIKRGLTVGRAALGKLILVGLALMLTLLPAILLASVPSFLRGVQYPATIAEALVDLALGGAMNAVGMLLFTAASVQVYRLRAGLTTTTPS